MIGIDLSGKQALVCGASRGIGAETAKALAKAGAQVTLVARDETKLKIVVESLEGSGHKTLALDLSHPNDTFEKATELVKNNGTYHILVCNAGGPKAGPLIEAEEDNFETGFKTHVLSNQALAKALTPGMIDAGYGRIVNVISTSVKVPIQNLGVSNTIRGAVASWAKTLANELGPKGVTVNNVLPGFTNTERLSTLATAAATRLKKSEDEVRTMWINAVPARRFAEPSETASAIAFLVSPLAGYINGVNLPVDGGRTGTL